jgi:hypothetical protein
MKILLFSFLFIFSLFADDNVPQRRILSVGGDEIPAGTFADGEGPVAICIHHLTATDQFPVLSAESSDLLAYFLNNRSLRERSLGATHEAQLAWPPQKFWREVLFYADGTPRPIGFATDILRSNAQRLGLGAEFENSTLNIRTVAEIGMPEESPGANTNEQIINYLDQVRLRFYGWGPDGTNLGLQTVVRP